MPRMPLILGILKAITGEEDSKVKCSCLEQLKVIVEGWREG